MKKYRSKIGYGILIFVFSILIGTSVIMVVNHTWPGLYIIIGAAVFVSYIFFSIYYVIDENTLLVKCGFFLTTKVKIENIYKIEETNNPLSSPAASLDRLSIYYHKKGWIMVSPKDKMQFIDNLKAINPNIEVKMKSNRINKNVSKLL